MTSLDIINRALTSLAAAEATSLADTAKNAAAAIDAYATARDEILRLLAPPTCLKRAVLLGWHDQATPWAASTRYEVGDRRTNDTAKTYICTARGKSAAAGGPTGTSTGITDGTVTWDYVEASTTANNWCWAATTAYVVGDLVSNNSGRVYRCITAGTSAGSGGPTGETDDITDNTAHWAFYGKPVSADDVYDFAYIMPVDCLRLLKLPKASASKESDQGEQYKLEGITVYCNVDDESTPVIAKYVEQVANVNQWGNLVRTVVAYKLAAEIAYVVTGKPEHVKQAEQKFATWYSVASGVEALEGEEAPEKPKGWEE